MSYRQIRQIQMGESRNLVDNVDELFAVFALFAGMIRTPLTAREINIYRVNIEPLLLWHA